MVHPAQDGYLLTARGNPFGNVVRKGEKVIVHSDSGLDFEVPTLKTLAASNKWKNPDRAVSAKIRTPAHVEKIECYGCHVKIDFSGKKTSTDWVAAGSTHFPDGRFVYQVVSKIGAFLDLVPKNDPEHRTLISRAMFIAANVEIFGTMALAILALLLVVFTLRRRRRRRA